MTELHHHLAVNLKSLRNQYGYSQAELAEKSDVSVGYIGEIEVRHKFPSPEVLEKLAQVFHVRPFQLLLSPQDFLEYQTYLNHRDFSESLGEKILQYFETRRLQKDK